MSRKFRQVFGREVREEAVPATMSIDPRNTDVVYRLARAGRRLVAAAGAGGTLWLAAVGHERQAWMALATLATFLLSSRWRNATTVLGLAVVMFLPTLGGVALTVPVLLGLGSGSLAEFISQRRTPPRWFALAGAALAFWIVVVLIFSKVPLEAADSRSANTIVVACEVILAVLASRGLTAPVLVRATALLASALGWAVAFTPGEAMYAGRHGGAGLDPNYAGLVLAVGLVLSGALALRGERSLALVCAPGLLAGTALSQSRGAVVAIAAGAAVLLLTRSGVFNSARARVLTVLGGGGLAALFVLFSVLRAGTWAEASVTQRWGAARLAIDLGVAHPWVGVGWRSFREFARADPELHAATNASNEYLQLAAEGGLLTLALFVGLLALALRRPTTLLRRSLLAGALTWMVGLLFNDALATSAVSLAPLLLIGALAGSAPSAMGPVSRMVNTEPRAVPHRVVLCVGNLNLGGTEHQVVLLARELVARGVDVHVITFRAGPRRADLLAAGVRSTVLNCFPEGYRWRGVPMVVMSRKFLRILRSERPDVVHGFLLHAYIFSGILAKIAGVPVVVTGRRSLGELDGRSAALRFAARLANSVTNAVVANATAVADDSVLKEGIRPDRVVTIHNAVDVAPALGQRVDESRDLLRIVNIANLRRHKAQVDLVDAAAMVNDQGVRVQIQVVGEGPEREALASRAATLGVDLVLHGHRRDVADVLLRADVYVHSSLVEGMSNAVMEAMASGLPIVATDVGGTAELLGGCGLLVPPGDPSALALGLLTVAGDRAAASLMGEAARARVAAEFSPDALARRHLNLYGGLLEQTCAE